MKAMTMNDAPKRESPLVAYCDGGAAVRDTGRFVRGTGAAAFAFRYEGRLIYGRKKYSEVTNNQMELQAAIKVLQEIQARVENPETAPVIVISDSQYVVQGVNEWCFGWKKRNWKTSAGKAVINRTLWEELLAVKASMSGVTFEWVRGHSGVEMNEFVDGLASKAMEEGAPEQWTVTVL